MAVEDSNHTAHVLQVVPRELTDEELGATVRACAAVADMHPTDWLRMRAVEVEASARVARHLVEASEKRSGLGLTIACVVWQRSLLEADPRVKLDEWAATFAAVPECGDVVHRHADQKAYVVMARRHHVARGTQGPPSIVLDLVATEWER